MSLLEIGIPLPLDFVDQHLLGSELIASTLSNPTQPQFSRWYNPDMRYEYHCGVLSHFSSTIAKISRIEFGSW
jgi:hypothetical protein